MRLRMTHVDLSQEDPARANAQLSTGNFQAVASRNLRIGSSVSADSGDLVTAANIPASRKPQVLTR